MSDMSSAFDDLLAANRSYAETFDLAGFDGVAHAGVAMVTCMDSRIDPLRMLGLQPGDAKIVRNAGARVSDDVLRTLVLASHLLGVERVMIIAHTGCRMTTDSEGDVHAAIEAAGGPDTRSLKFLTTSDQRASVAADVQRIRSWPFLGTVIVGGFVYDIDSGQLEQVC